MSILDAIFGSSIPHIHPAEAHEKMKSSPKPFLLDVREPEEFRQAHIQGATLIPLGSLPSSLARIPKNREILVICASGSRSVPATRTLIQAGFHATNVRGGISGWMRAGFPVQRKK